MEVSALNHRPLPGLRGPAPLLRLQSDERLVALVRRGHHGAFEALVSRYESRLLAFCRHMLSSREDAEDVLQEVFTAAFNAMLADTRDINVRPWLYRIARNRSLNHLRRASAIGVDSMDVHFADQGQSTTDKVFKREAFRQLIHDVQLLPETQRTALLLREIDALSYDQISEAMETTVPSVKSLLVRARISLAEAAEARQLSCDDVRLELGEVAEGLKKSSPPVRRHLRECDTCEAFRKHLKTNNQTMAAVFPVGAFLLVKKVILAKVGASASAGGAQVGGATAAAAGAGAAGAGAAGAGGSAGIFAAGAGALATKAVAGLAAAAFVTAGAVEVNNSTNATHHSHPRPALAAAVVPRAVPVVRPLVVTPSPVIVRSVSQSLSGANATLRHAKQAKASAPRPHQSVAPAVTTSTTASATQTTTTVSTTTTRTPTSQVQSDVTVLPSTPAPATTPTVPVVTTPTVTAPPTTTSSSATQTSSPVAPVTAPPMPTTTVSVGTSLTTPVVTVTETGTVITATPSSTSSASASESTTASTGSSSSATTSSTTP